MVEIGIPVYKALNTLGKGLDSLVAQTYDQFSVCLSIDGDNEDYSELIATYRARGLNIRVIESEKNEGPGMARQKILDTTESDYIMFMDADDMLMPRAVEVLYNGAIKDQYDVLRSSFIREGKEQSTIIPQNVPTITWFHGKIYRVGHIKEKNIRFHPLLRTEEDAYFNILCWNSAEKRGETTEVTYLWRDNKDSLTRAEPTSMYLQKNYLNYVFSQVEALKAMPFVMKQMPIILIGQTLINIYNHYQSAVFYELPLEEMNRMVGELKEFGWMQNFLNNDQIWAELLKYLKPGNVFDGKAYYYKEPFDDWLKRLLGV